MAILAALGSFVTLTALFALYIWSNDKKMKAPPPNNLGSKAWSNKLIHDTYERVSTNPRLLEGRLQPKTGRRYIVVGGVSAAQCTYLNNDLHTRCGCLGWFCRWLARSSTPRTR